MKNLINKTNSHYFYNYFHIIIMIIILKYKFLNCNINDNFEKNILEYGNYDILDITDTTNLKLLVTTSKKIYEGIPPTQKSVTGANLINSTSLLTINNNYILAACLQNSLLTKININNGQYSSLLEYNQITINPGLEIPITTCSISTINDFIFIAYSRIEYYDTQTNKTHILIELKMQNKDSEDGPILDPNSEKKVFTFPNSTSKTDSSRQIICQPLKILNENQNFRLVCVYEDLEFDAENYQMFRNYDYGVVINNDFNGFDIEMNTIRIYRTNVTGGIGFYKLNETYAKFVMRRLFLIYI